MVTFLGAGFCENGDPQMVGRVTEPSRIGDQLGSSNFHCGKTKKNKGDSKVTTVDGQNPAPPRMMIIPLFIGF